jgi:hypothetical protein
MVCSLINFGRPVRAKIFVYALPALILATIHFAEAQQPTKIFRIGFLDSNNYANYLGAFAICVDTYQSEFVSCWTVDRIDPFFRD